VADTGQETLNQAEKKEARIGGTPLRGSVLSHQDGLARGVDQTAAGCGYADEGESP
jgi:hypothetical protein